MCTFNDLLLIYIVLILIIFVNYFQLKEKLDKLCHGDHKTHLPCLAGMDAAELAFRLTDTNKDGFVDKNEFKKITKNLPKDKVEKAFQNCDTNKDGKLDIHEFKEMMKTRKKK